jgi:hypothetical protein
VPTPTRCACGWIRAAALAAILGCSLPSAAAATDFSKYHNYQELSGELRALIAANPSIARIASIGKTREGRDIWAVELANQAGKPVDQRPALLVAANFEGDHVIGSELALFLVDFLVKGYGTDAAIRQRLDNHVIYVLPRVNPDGAELMFAPFKTGRRTNATPFDADNDGRMDEDGPEDLNKDGFVTVMRVKDPKGPYMISPDDPRLMRRADPARGETGGWAIYREGLDKDNDGFIAEDGPGGVDINRNFMHQYPYYQPDAGRYMVSETETRAVLDYVLARRNIAAILAFGESDNLIVSPTRAGSLAAPNPINLLDFADRSVADSRRVGIFPDLAGFGGRGGGRGMVSFDEGGGPAGGGRGGQQAQGATGRAAMPAQRPNTTVAIADYEYYRAIGEKYRELTGLRATGYTRTPAGAFFEYGYYQYGVPSFSTPGWGLPGAARPNGTGAPGGPAGAAPAMGGGQRGGQRGGGAGTGGDVVGGDSPEGIDLRLLQWMDAEKVDGFVPWKAFSHPTLGQVEIGGFKPYATTNPPAARIADLGASHAKFALYLSSLFPKIAIAKSEVTALGAGLYRITVDVENSGYLPTALSQAVQARAVKPVMVQLGVPPESIITGDEKTNHINALAGAGTRQSFEWVIKGKPGTSVTVRAVSQKSGSDTATLTLQ